MLVCVSNLVRIALMNLCSRPGYMVMWPVDMIATARLLGRQRSPASMLASFAKSKR